MHFGHSPSHIRRRNHPLSRSRIEPQEATDLLNRNLGAFVLHDGKMAFRQLHNFLIRNRPPLQNPIRRIHLHLNRFGGRFDHRLFHRNHDLVHLQASQRTELKLQDWSCHKCHLWTCLGIPFNNRACFCALYRLLLCSLQPGILWSRFERPRYVVQSAYLLGH